MKIIFLDIDGPIAFGTLYDGKVHIKRGLSIPYPWLQSECAALSRIIAATDAKIVLSSDWRLYYTIDEMNSVLEFYGVPGVIIDCTDNFKAKMSSSGGMDRAYQILKWVKDNNPEAWVAIDDYDLEFAFYSEGYIYNSIMTRGSNSDIGIPLSAEEFNIINMLNSEREDKII